MNRARGGSLAPSVALALALCACSDETASPGATGSTTGSGGSETTSTTGSGAGGGGTTTGSGAGGASMFAPNPALAGLGDDSAVDLGPFTCTPVPGEDPDLCRRTTDYSGFVYDPHRHKMLAFGGGHSTTMTDAIHELDLGGTLTWGDLQPPTPCDQMTAANLDADDGAWLSGTGPYPRPVSSHTYDMLAVAPKLGDFLVISRNFTGGYCNVVGNDIGGRIAHFDRAAGTWSFSPTASGSTYDLGVNIPGSEPDPISGDVVLFGGGGLGLYDPATRAYSQPVDTYNGDQFLDSTASPADLTGIGYANHLVYFPPDDTFYLFNRDDPVQVFALKLDRADPGKSTVDRLTTSGSGPPGGEVGYDYDAKNHVIGGGVQGSTFYAFDPATKAWSAHTMGGAMPGNVAFHALAYDPVDNVFVFVTDYDSGAHTWAYRLSN